MKRDSFFSTAAITCLIFLAMLVGFSWDTVWYSFKEPVDIYEQGYDFVEAGKGGHIETTLFASLDKAVSQTTTTKSRRGGTTTTTKHYYIVPVYDADDNEYYVCVEVLDSNKSPYTNLVNETWEYYFEGTQDIPPEGVKFTGTAKKLDKDIYKHVKDWFEEAEWFESDADIEKYVLPIRLVAKSFEMRNAFMIGYVVLAGLSILCFVISRKRNKKFEQKEEEFRQQTQVVMGDEVYVTLPMGSYPKRELARVDAFLAGQDKIQAIAAFRDITGCGLAEAKDIVDHWYDYYI